MPCHAESHAEEYIEGLNRASEPLFFLFYTFLYSTRVKTRNQFTLTPLILQLQENGRRFGSTQARWSSAGRIIGRVAVLPLIFEGFYDIGTMARCACTSD